MDETPLWSAPFGLKLLQIIRMKRRSSVLDIGFGFGFPLVEIALRLGNDSRVVGIDPWDLALEKTRTKIETLGLQNIHIIHGKAETLPFPGATFDLITSNNGINNVADIPASLREIHRVAKPGAQFVFTMNTETTMIEFYDVLEQVLKEMRLPSAIQAMKDHIYEKRKPSADIQDWLAQSGFRIMRILEDSFTFRYSDGSAMLNHYLIRDGFLSAWVKFLPRERLEAIFDQVEQRLNAVAKREGELPMTVPFLTFECEK